MKWKLYCFNCYSLQRTNIPSAVLMVQMGPVSTYYRKGERESSVFKSPGDEGFFCCRMGSLWMPPPT